MALTLPYARKEALLTRRRYRRPHNRKTRVQIRQLARIWIAGAAALLLALTAAALLFGSAGGRPGFEAGDLLVCANGDGTLDLSWPQAGSPAMYLLEFRCGETHFEKYYTTPAARLSGVPAGEELRIQIQAVADGKPLFGKPRQLHSWKTLKARVTLPEELPVPEAEGSLESGTVSLRWTGDGKLYKVFALGNPTGPGNTLVATTGETSLTLSTDRVPSGEPLRLAVRQAWKRRGFVLCGPASVPVTLNRQNFPGGPLSLSCREELPRMYILEWNGVSCDHFAIQEWREEGWQTVGRRMPQEHMRYDTGRLRSGSYHRFRVAAMGGDGTEIQAEETAFHASISPLYSTVWPIQDLALYENPGKGDRLATVPGGTALCVLSEEGSWFRVRFGDEYGWLDSRFCMINLPEYVGDHCDYDIANSYDSIFAVHGSPIRTVTHQVIQGFEHMRTAEGDFLVPYLYPCAQKLLTAAQAAEADGLRLKIYEAFRPNRATRFLYDTTSEQLDAPALPDTGPGDEGGMEAAPGSGGSSSTIYKLMTNNGRYRLGSFLAKVTSTHNRGIALDLTLADAVTGEELAMQSDMHDLSWYSATNLNNLNAKVLANYMTAAGMNGLSSEWWHFQDDKTRESIGLNSYLYEGVSAEGWTQDDAGWRYRNADGSYACNTALTIDGRSYTFDAAGYAAG